MKDYTSQQQEAIRHLHEWRVGALFMEPGTGKTRVALSLVNSTDCSDVFYIGPLRTLEGIKSEVEKWGGFKMKAHYYGVESLSGSDRIYLELLSSVEAAKNPFVVVDESLKIKNSEAKRTRRVLEIGKHAEWKLVLNGTPISHNLMDMWPQMEFLSPKILNMSLAQFKQTFCTYTTITKRFGSITKRREFITGMENVDYLHSLIRHYVYECDLKLNIGQKWNRLYYSITEESRDAYDEVKMRYLSDEMLEWRNNNIFMAMTTELQLTYATDPAKIEAINKLFSEGIKEEETIIFCRWISSQEICRRLFPKAAILSFQKESFGLNLQQYSVTIFFDKVFDYALLLQASRRTFRTGQSNDCFYYEVTSNTGLDRLIDRNIEKKISMSEYLKKVSKETLMKEL